MHKALQVLCGGLQYDNRAKRNLSALQEFAEVKILATERSRPRNTIFKLKLCFNVLKEVLFLRYRFVYAEGLWALALSLPGCVLTFTPLVYDSRELYLNDEKGQSTYGLRHRIVEKFCLLFVKHIVSTNEERVAYMKNYYGTSKAFTFVRNISDLKPNFSHSKKYDKKRIVYQGVLGRLRGIEKFLSALPYLKTECEVVFIVPKAEHPRLNNMINKYASNNKIIVLDFFTPAELQVYLQSCDLGYLAYELIGPNNTYCEPNKLYEYAYAGLPLLSSPQPLFQKIFKNYKIGHLISADVWEEGIPLKLAGEIEIALSKTYELEEFKKFAQDYNYQIEKKRFLDFIRKHFQEA
jgi:glycosyltransferase involved in cell wall biosynthesis